MLQRLCVRRLVRFTAALAFASLAGRTAAQTTPATMTAEELAAVGITPPRSWELTGNVRGAFGYKENLLLSAIRSDNSAFVQTEGEVFWWRLPTERFEALAFANASLTRFVESDENPKEWQAFAHGEARWFVSPSFETTATVEAYHIDQVFDLSATTAEHLVAKLAVTGAVTTAAFRWKLRPNTWIELKPATQRDRYRDGSDDNRQHFARLGIGQGFFGGRVQLALAGQMLRRTYDHRPQYTAAGRPLTGTELEFDQREGEIRADVTWDEAQCWTTATSAVLGTNDDNGSGFFDYEHRYVRQEITWTRAPWKVRLTGRIGRYDYAVQTVGIGINPPQRQKDEYLAQMRCERQWTEKTRLYADYRWERSRSNDPLADYRVNTASAGLDWAF